ncbi:hypothetical protein NEMBOFW57_004126 [Staphylotrichum longicolle]|uniref:Heterokaryon incompatibility domain-containing protein n=1 Tax=Staphylotrichum longicolle TaxID=669026 RepID=A0AAD4I057_9PEZI|nr:hypothetical protein NEMBOFW57_004126 [Staphylotrichum longicolle]
MALPLDTAKLQGNAMAKVLDMVDLTPETLAKTFKDFGESPEKLRALLNLWFVPWFKPTFVPDQKHAVAGLRDVEFLGTADLPPGQLPYRMFDIETGNLVEFPAIGARGQYCMLSHRWKGVELTLSYIKEARRKELERARDARKQGRTTKCSGKKGDVELVLNQSRLDIEEQESLVRDLYVEEEPAQTPGSVEIGRLLNRRLKARGAEDALGWARDSEDQIRSKLRFAQMEQRIFSHLVDQMQEQVQEKLEEHLGPPDEADKTRLSSSSSLGVGNEVVNGVRAELTAAEYKLKTAQANRDSVQGDIEYFQRHHHLRDALDELVRRLQMWKSAIKLERAIELADEIFKTKLFQHREKCYLWTDTCCIDKSNGGELSESLSLMGDWYADAEFTLVQIDTPYREADAVRDWQRFEVERKGGKVTDTKPNIQGFGDVKGYRPEWSTRAWTLQELVMSKTTFYVNSEWTPLSRPVESLGYFYYLIPFIALYTRGDSTNIYASSGNLQGFWNVSILENIAGSQGSLGGLERLRENIKGRKDEVVRVEVAQKLIALLEAVGVPIPSNLTAETSTSELARAVYIAAADSADDRETSSGRREILRQLQQHLPKPDLSSLPGNLSEKETTEEMAQHAINFILQCLVAETEELILADRKYVADFGQVEQLGAWQQGTGRTGFSAQSVLEVSGKRKATVATDRSYALMGVLGVRFPTFPAEGYVKALARLLDEVVITRNDVSVFNWTGMEMGSSIRGRSMYPSSHTAYGNLEDRGKRYNLLLSARAQDKMADVVATYHTVIHTLRSAIDFLKDKERKSLPLNWIERIVQLILLNGFRELKPQQDAFGRIIGYIGEYCKKERLEAAKEKEAKMAETAATSPTTPDKETYDAVHVVHAVIVNPFVVGAIVAIILDVVLFVAREEDVDTGKKASKFSGLGKSVKAPSFGLLKKGSDSTPIQDPVAAEAPATPQSPEPADAISDPPPPYEKVETAPSWQVVDREVMEYLSTPTTLGVTKSLPEDVQSIKFEQPRLEHPSTRSSRKQSFEDHNLDTISPNPIIVNNSGIEGLFDIQRVIVTMISPDKLRRQIAKAASPHNKISGWCSISTGFARVITSFACERHILEQELDVIESVEAQVLREQDKDKGNKRADRLLKTLSITKSAAEQAINPHTHDPSHPQPPKDTSTNTTTTTEERLITRMLAFIQQPHLPLIAGEWVLARFSSTPGAHWFLCHLTLGPTPHQYYGQRIAAGAIDFHDATPEPGLVHAWQTYMDRKKRKMCYLLGDYLRGRMMGREGEERLRAGEGFARQGLDAAVKGVGVRVGVVGWGLGGATATTTTTTGPEEGKVSTGGEEGSGEAGQSGVESDDEEEEEQSVLDKVLGQGKLAAKALGEYTVLAVAEKLFEMRADHLDKTLATAVLKRTPKSLRTAVENINDNKSFLPAMFHSSTRVHMF